MNHHRIAALTCMRGLINTARVQNRYHSDVFAFAL